MRRERLVSEVARNRCILGSGEDILLVMLVQWVCLCDFHIHGNEVWLFWFRCEGGYAVIVADLRRL